MTDLYDKLIDAVTGECDTTNLDRGAARMQIKAVLGATPERLAALKRVGEQYVRALGRNENIFIDARDLRDVLTLAGYYSGGALGTTEQPVSINPAEVLRSIARDLARETGRVVDEAAFDRAAAVLAQPVAPVRGSEEYARQAGPHSSDGLGG